MLKIKKIREVRREEKRRYGFSSNINIADETVEYFVYNERGIQGSACNTRNKDCGHYCILSIRNDRSK